MIHERVHHVSTIEYFFHSIQFDTYCTILITMVVRRKNMLCTIRLLLETDDRANMKTKIKHKWSKWKYYSVKS